MPTDKDMRNPGALMKAAENARDPQARTQAAADTLLSRLAESEDFAAQLDEAVMREDKDKILSLIAEAGVSDEIEVSIDELTPDAMLQLKFCLWVFCVSITFSW